VYPVVLRLEGRRCLVVGGGVVARRKVEGLLAAGAQVAVVATVVDDELRRLAQSTTAGRLAIEERPYRAEDLDGMWLAIAATDDAAVQQAVADDGERARVWVNAADDPDRCAFFLPAVHRRDPVLLAVSTQGTSPALAGWLRDRLALALPARLEDLVTAVAAERSAVQASGRSTEGLDWLGRIDELADALGGSPERVAPHEPDD
jgi:siroheme synthase-like protein